MSNARSRAASLIFLLLVSTVASAQRIRTEVTPFRNDAEPLPTSNGWTVASAGYPITGRNPFPEISRLIEEQRAAKERKFGIHEPRIIRKWKFKHFDISIPLEPGESGGIIFLRIEF